MIRNQRPAFDRFIVVVQAKLNIGMSQRQPGDRIGNMAHLGADCFQEFFPGRGIKKQLLNRNQGSHRGPDFRDTLYFATVDNDLRPDI